MKYHLLTLLITLIIGAAIYFLDIKLSNPTITVLEVHIQVIDSEKYHRVTYNEKSFKSNITRSIDFKSFSGVDNYIDQVADFNISQWRTQ